MYQLLRKEMEQVGFDHKKKSVVEYVESALDWISKQEDNSNYMHNLKVACANKYITETSNALVASLIPTFDKALEKEAIKKEKEAAKEKEIKVSNYQGNIKDRITFNFVSCKCVTSFETYINYYVQTLTYIYKFTDEKGNVYIWKTQKNLENEKGTITGTVKEHTEYNGVKQTVLTRCKIK